MSLNYEEEQERLLALWLDVSPCDDEIQDSGSDADIDDVEISHYNSDSEQEIEEEETEESFDAVSRETEPSTSTTHKRNAEDKIVHQPFYLSKDKKIKWIKSCPTTAVRTRSENIIVHLPGVKGSAKGLRSPMDCFLAFIDEDMIKDIVRYTNQRLLAKAEIYNADHQYIVKPTNEVEIKAVFGLLYLAGVFKSNRLNLEDLWSSDGTGIDIFRRVMSLQRFKMLLVCLRFDNKQNREERKQIDKFTAIRAIFEKFVSNCQLRYSPSEYCTIDEQLYSFRGRCPFRQYMPNKPARYGIKMFALVDAKTYYVVNMEPYVGRQPNGPFQKSNSAFDVVDRLVSPISGTKRNVTFDNWFTSFPLMKHLLHKHKLTSVGTVRKNKAELPNKFISTKNREVASSLFGFQKYTTILSYVPKKGKVVLVASTLHHDNAIDASTGEAQKPEMITFYNFTKGGVDVVDELSTSYDVSRNSNRWPLTVFFALLNIAGINSLVIYRSNINNFKVIRRQYLKELGLALVQNHMKIRVDCKQIPRTLRKSIQEIVENDNQGEPAPKKLKGRCAVCPRGRDRKCQKKCAACEVFLCLDHAVTFCQNCSLHNLK